MPWLTLTTPPPTEVVAGLVRDEIASRIARGDTTVWPALARPGWVDAPRTARPLAGAIEALREQFRVAGVTRVVVATAGGAGLAAEALAGAEPRLIVLDTPDPVQVADALAGDLSATVLVVAVPPGEDPTATLLVTAAVHDAFRAEGIDPDEHTVVVGSPADSDVPADPGIRAPDVRASGAMSVPGPADVDGLWSAFTASALVPAGLAGADPRALLADAAAFRETLAADEPGNPALVLGALLAGAPAVALTGDGPVEWVAQLVAGGLGKDGRGPLPVPVEGPDAPGWADPGTLRIGIGDVEGADVCVHGPIDVNGPIGDSGGASVAPLLLLWQHAVAVAAHLLGVDPTDRPDAATGTGPAAPDGEPTFFDGAVAVHAGPWLPAGSATVADALRALVAAGDGTAGSSAAGNGAHLALHAYLDREGDASAAVLRPELARRTGLTTTFDWAPRCLAGSGQRAKGGPADGVVCQLTGAVDGLDGLDALDGGADAGAEVGAALGKLQQAQARADADALASRGRPVLRLHFTDRVAGLVTLVRAVQQL